MFTVILAVVALADYVIIFCCIVNMVAKPAAGAEETPEAVFERETDQTMDCAVMEYINDDEEFYRYIEEQNSRIAALSFNVNEILSNIDTIIQKKR
jgi:hypothetical protein